MENNNGITQIVGWFKSPQTGAIHLFCRWGEKSFHWMSCQPFRGYHDILIAPGVKIFPQEPELELYQATTWEEAKKWFQNS